VGYRRVPPPLQVAFSVCLSVCYQKLSADNPRNMSWYNPRNMSVCLKSAAVDCTHALHTASLNIWVARAGIKTINQTFEPMGVLPRNRNIGQQRQYLCTNQIKGGDGRMHKVTHFSRWLCLCFCVCVSRNCHFINWYPTYFAGLWFFLYMFKELL
jgi:hypothetical protein